MPTYQARLGAQQYRFPSLKALLGAASPRRSGDELAGLAARSETERAAAQRALSEVPLRQFLEEPVVPYEDDEVTRLIFDRHDRSAFAPISGLSVGEFRDYLLRHETESDVLRELRPGLTPEMVAAVSKLMRVQDLIQVASKCQVVTAFRTTLGLEGRLSARLQPNHPTDDPRGIAAGLLDGLSFGMGDAVIGINPARDSVGEVVTLLRMLDDFRVRFDIPVQSCVLSHLTTSMQAIEVGAPLDLMFQSIAGSEAANRAFGINLAILGEAEQATTELRRGVAGTDVMYFETGQGSALSSNAHHGVDQQTMEARAYAVAREFSPLLVNSVVGFIGPEYLFDSKQILRAGLEDHFCGKMLGLPMGMDVCYTNHAEADQDDMDALALLLTGAGVTFLIAVPGGDDVMLGYQSLSYHDVATLRRLLKKRPAPEFEDWLIRFGLFEEDGLLLSGAPADRALRKLLSEGHL